MTRSALSRASHCSSKSGCINSQASRCPFESHTASLAGCRGPVSARPASRLRQPHRVWPVPESDANGISYIRGFQP